MDILFYVFAGAAGIAAALATIAIWAPRPTRVRVIAVLITTLFIPVVYVEMAEMLSKPKPISFEWYEKARVKAQILGVSLKEGEAIYMWLRPEGMLEPRYYVIPWNLKLAEKLEEVMEGAVRTRSRAIITQPFLNRRAEDWGDANIEIVPPPLPPMKPPVIPPQIFNPRDKSV